MINDFAVIAFIDHSPRNAETRIKKSLIVAMLCDFV